MDCVGFNYKEGLIWMFFNWKNKFKRAVVKADNAKKVNPLDLSSDQDLTIAVMNLIKLEKLLDGYDIKDDVRDMRCRLMGRVVPNGDEKNWDMSQYLLEKSVELMGNGMQEIGIDSGLAYKMFDDSYEFYSMFWGINMGIIDVSDVDREVAD